VTDTEPSKTDADLERLLAAWKSATPEARRIFAETHFNPLDGWPAAKGIREQRLLQKVWAKAIAPLDRKAGYNPDGSVIAIED
jgi:hypothetical protein